MCHYKLICIEVLLQIKKIFKTTLNEIKRMFGLNHTRTITIQLEGKPKIPITDLFSPSRATKHAKPSTPYGYILDGNKEVAFRLPEDSEELERNVMNKFVFFFNKQHGQITNVSKLPESDHDFEMFVDGSSTIVQLTESSLRGVGQKWGLGFQFDGRAYFKLLEAIRRKVKKNYPKPSGKEFWLIVWQNDVSIGADQESMRLAFNYLLNYKQPFDRIYYMWFYSDEPAGLIKEVWRSGSVWRADWLEDNDPLDSIDNLF